MMQTLVTAPAITAPIHSLLFSGNIVDDGDGKWENGVTFTQRGCYEILGSCATCELVDNEDPQECHAPAVFDPYLLDLGIVYGTPDRYDIKDLATETMEVGTSSRLERLIWAGCAGGTSPTLSDATVVGTSASPKAALGSLMAELISSTGHTGALGTIHMSPRIVVELGDLLRTNDRGDLITQAGGHLVIVGDYPATHIAGHVGGIDVYLGEPYLTEAPDEIRRANVQTFQVQRLALAAWNTCAAFLAPVTLTSGIDGGTP